MDGNFSLTSLPQFNCDSDLESIGQRWKRYISRFENFAIATNILASKRKRALLLHCAGDSVQDILEYLPNKGDTYESTLEALNAHFAPCQNIELENYKFRQLVQFKAETLEQFYTRLRHAAETCDFGNADREIKSQIIVGCSSTKLRKHALQNPTLTLLDLLKHGKTAELADKHSAEIEAGGKQTVNWIETEPGKPQDNMRSEQKFGRQRQPRIQQRTSNKKRDQCSYCGQQWHPDGLQNCKARGQTCRQCGKQNHFARVCLSQLANTSQQQRQAKPEKKNWKPKVVNLIDSDNEDESQLACIYTNSTGSNKDHTLGTVVLKLGKTPVSFIIDSGATVNIINKQQLDETKLNPIIEPPGKTVFPYGQKKPLDIIGKFVTTVQHKTRCYQITIFITNAPGPALLSKTTSLKMDLIRFVNVTSPTSSDTYEQRIISQFPKLFQKMGKHKTAIVKLHVDKTVPPVAQKHRRIPFHLRAPVEEELRKLQESDIIERVPRSSPTPWVSPIVIVPKKDSNQIRICVDMRLPNTAIQRVRHITPTIEDILYDLNGATHFSKLDLLQGYHQLELDPKSRPITTFTTHAGLYRYKRLNFGVNAAAEIFQHEISKTIDGIPGTINISDDILVYAKTQHQHDDILFKTLKRLSDAGLVLNKTKCVYNKNNLKFFGHIFSKDGMTADPDKINSIRQAELPKSATEVRSFLGMVTFCSRYIPNLATLTQPLRELTQKDTEWIWSDKHQQAFDHIIQQLTSNVKLSYYDLSLPTEIWTDASPVGVAAILVQRKQDQPLIIAFGSKALSPTETRYSQIEREALAVTWSMEHFNIYVYGVKFKVITDHKPLVNLFNNPRANLSARMERWRLRMQPYLFQVEYREGKSNPADYLSRHPSGDTELNQVERNAEDYINFVSLIATPKSISLEEVKENTKEDLTIQTVMSHLQTGKWYETPPGVEKTILQAFHKIEAELSVTSDGLTLLRGPRVVLPISLQDRAIELAHSGHQGIVKTKQLIRSKTWFPNIDKKIEEKVRTCIPCCAATNTHGKTPLNTATLPKGPWEHLHMDHKGPLPSGEYLLVVVDLYSRYPIVEVVNSTSSAANIPKLNNIFSLFGRPISITTDNGAPFNSFEFAQYMSTTNITHRRITPVWPQANGIVERFNETLSKILRIAHNNKHSWKFDLQEMLLSYRATPHTSTGISPAELLMNRQLNLGFPTLPKLADSPTINKEIVSKKDMRAKNNSKRYHDSRHKMIREIPQKGDKVLVRQPMTSKLSTPFNIQPLTVTSTKGTMITAQRDNGQSITRNASHYKILNSSVMMKGKEDASVQKAVLTTPHEYNLRSRHKDKIANAYPKT